MVSLPASLSASRRQLLLGALSACLPLAGRASIVYTPHELREQYRREVSPRLPIPADEVRLYGGIAELQLYNVGRQLLQPQYLLVIDANPHVQAAMLFWRLLPGSYELVGASPVSTLAGARDEATVPQGLFDQQGGGATVATCRRSACGSGRQRVYDFGWQRSGLVGAAGMRVQVRAADRRSEQRLGAPCAQGCILLPASLISFLDEYGVLDDGVAGRAQRHVLPYRGRHLMLVDSERDDRPSWSPAPASPPTVARAGR